MYVVFFFLFFFFSSRRRHTRCALWNGVQTCALPILEQTARLAVPRRPGEWLAGRRARLDTRLKEFGRAARTGTIPGGIIENGKLHIDKLRADTPEGAEDLVLDLYQQLPPARITD